MNDINTSHKFSENADRATNSVVKYANNAIWTGNHGGRIGFITARRYASAVYTVVMCLSVCVTSLILENNR